MESVGCARAMCRGISERIDNLELLDDRAGPAVRNDERQSIFMFGTNVNEMNVESIDLSDELRPSVQFRLAFAPILICRPIAREFLNHRERHALRIIRHRFPPCIAIKLEAATAPEATRTVRRSGDDSFVGMTFLLAVQIRGAANVRFGSKADIEAASPDVRFTPKSGHGSARSS
jgi:hypothetical protein